jgi:hypothetical protein
MKLEYIFKLGLENWKICAKIKIARFRNMTKEVEPYG